jgi:hypothetical protein
MRSGKMPWKMPTVVVEAEETVCLGVYSNTSTCRIYLENWRRPKNSG